MFNRLFPHDIIHNALWIEMKESVHTEVASASLNTRSLSKLEKKALDSGIYTLYANVFNEESCIFLLNQGFYMVNVLPLTNPVHFRFTLRKILKGASFQIHEHSPLFQSDSIKVEFTHIKHQQAYLEAAQNSRLLHGDFVRAALTQQDFLNFIAGFDWHRCFKFIVKENKSDRIAGVINLSEIVYGDFNSGYLGYYGFTPFERKGYMSEGLKFVLDYAKNTLRLHRLEANIQPQNQASIGFIKKFGFTKEGYSKDYIRIDEQYCDHERWGLIL